MKNHDSSSNSELDFELDSEFDPEFDDEFGLQPDMVLIYSPLAQSITRDGKTVHVIIYKDEHSGWTLEVEDEYRNSTLWDDEFVSDQEALNTVLEVIRKEGIDVLIGAPGTDEKGLPLAEEEGLTLAEMDELNDFLVKKNADQMSMNAMTLEGFLTAIAIGPRLVPPSEWLPWVWDVQNGITAPGFDSVEEANRIMSLLMRHYNAVILAFEVNPSEFNPLFYCMESYSPVEWCEGFIRGFQISDSAWSILALEQPDWFAPFLCLGTNHGGEIVYSPEEIDRFVNGIRPALVQLHAHWKSVTTKHPFASNDHHFDFSTPHEVTTLVRDSPKIGRNDPCSCGSGIKFKKCCGAQ